MRLLFLSLLLTGMLPAGAQTATDYPQHDFRNPLGIPITLAGGFAECRPNHFHTGIDLKTNQQENLPVYAAAEGYISRISISHTGYGNAIYINHPNGYTTVYGHLNDFYPALQAYLEQQQYALERWNLDLSLTPGQFPVTKGQQIAWSGTFISRSAIQQQNGYSMLCCSDCLSRTPKPLLPKAWLFTELPKVYMNKIRTCCNLAHPAIPILYPVRTIAVILLYASA
jgi:hypothetical protein